MRACDNTRMNLNAFLTRILSGSHDEIKAREREVLQCRYNLGCRHMCYRKTYGIIQNCNGVGAKFKYMIKLYEVNVILISNIIILINKNNNNLNNNKIIP